AVAITALRPRRSETSATSWRTLAGRLLPLGGGFLLSTLPWLGWAVAGAGLPAVLDGLIIVPSRLADFWFGPLRQPIPAFWWLLGLYAAGVALSMLTLALARLRPGTLWAPWLVWGSLAAWGAALLFGGLLVQYTVAGLIYTWLYFN